MSYPFNHDTQQLWRVCVFGHDPDWGRWLFSETWSVTGVGPTATPPHFPQSCYQRWNFAFGLYPDAPVLLFGGVMFERVMPAKRFKFQSRSWSVTTSLQLNDAAPEAACRLQRVGATLGGNKYGRVGIPIFYDSWFTDRPHRRRIDDVTWDARLQGGAGTYPHTIVAGADTWQNVIYSRKTNELTDVTSYRLLPSACRIWQRWRFYDPDHDKLVSDDKFYPDSEPTRPFP